MTSIHSDRRPERHGGSPSPSRRIRSSLAAALPLLAAACGLAPDTSVQAVEMIYRDVRSWKDELDVTRARGASRTARGVPLTEVIARYNERRTKLQGALAGLQVSPRSPEDRRALEVMRHTLEETLGEERSSASGRDEAGASLDCAYDPARLAAGANGWKDLSDRMSVVLRPGRGQPVVRGQDARPSDGSGPPRRHQRRGAPEAAVPRTRAGLAVDQRRRRSGHQPLPAAGPPQRRGAGRRPELGRDARGRARGGARARGGLADNRA